MRVWPFLVLSAVPAAADEAATNVEDVLALPADAELGGFLASTCVTCHSDGAAGVPAIAGAPRAHLVQQLVAYRAGDRQHSTMETIARSLTDADIAALAAYFEDPD